MGAMKSMKRKMAALMSIMMLAAGVLLVPVPVGAVTTSDSVLEMKTESAGLNKGDTVEVVFNIKDTATTGFDGYLSYDKTLFDVQSFNETTDKPVEPDATGEWKATYESASQKISVERSGNEAVTLQANSKLLTVNFLVKKSVASTSISLQNATVYKNKEKTDKVSYPSGLTLTVTNSKAKTFTIATDNVSGNATISIPVRVTANSGFSKLTLTASFDNQKLFFDSVTVSNDIKGKVTQGAYTYTSGGGTVSVPFTATTDITGTGTLFYMNFKVLNQSSAAAAGTNSTSVTVGTEEVTNTKGEFFVLNSAVSTVFITEETHVTGDVNGDNQINLVDALYVIRYYNKTMSLASVELTAADVDKNGTVNLVDALRIMQYYNGVIKSF